MNEVRCPEEKAILDWLNKYNINLTQDKIDSLLYSVAEFRLKIQCELEELKMLTSFTDKKYIVDYMGYSDDADYVDPYRRASWLKKSFDDINDAVGFAINYHFNDIKEAKRHIEIRLPKSRKLTQKELAEINDIGLKFLDKKKKYEEETQKKIEVRELEAREKEEYKEYLKLKEKFGDKNVI